MTGSVKKFAIYGCGGFAREVLPILKENFEDKTSNDNKPDIVFVDDDFFYYGKSVNGVKVISFDELCEETDRKRQVSVAVANPKTRKKIVDKCMMEGFRFFDVVSNKATIYDENVIGEGPVLCANTVITSNTTIGKHFHCNIFSYVAHDCVIGDYVTFAPRVCCNGRIVMGDFVYVGTGAVFKQGVHGKPLHIGEGAVIGMGAVVTKDVPANVTVVGNPSKILEKRAP